MDEFERLEAYNEEFDILDELMDEELKDEFSEELAHAESKQYDKGRAGALRNASAFWAISLGIG